MANGSLATAHQSYDIPQVRRIGLPDLQMALWQGWDDFLAIPTQLVFLGILYPIIGIVAARAAEGGGLFRCCSRLWRGWPWWGLCWP